MDSVVITFFWYNFNLEKCFGISGQSKERHQLSYWMLLTKERIVAACVAQKDKADFLTSNLLIFIRYASF